MDERSALCLREFKLLQDLWVFSMFLLENGHESDASISQINEVTRANAGDSSVQADEDL